jgi:hypothetical protein
LSPRSYQILARDVRYALAKGAMLDGRVNAFIRDKRQRSEAYTKAQRRGPLARPQGVFALSTSIEEIRRRFAKNESAESKADARRQLRITMRFIASRIKEINNLYTKTKKQQIDGKMKTLTRRQWLEHTNNDMDYDMLHQSYEEHRLQWKNKDDPFYIDLGAPVDQEKRQRSIARSNILRDMSDGVFPASDESSVSVAITTRSARRAGFRDALDEAFEEALDQEADQDDTQILDYTQNTTQATLLPSETTLPSSPPASCL